MFKFLVKVFVSLYLLTMLIDRVDTLHVGRYWSEVLCSTIITHPGCLEVKVTDLEILRLSFWLKFLYEGKAKSSWTFLITFIIDVRLFSYFHKCNNGLLSTFM